MIAPLPEQVAGVAVDVQGRPASVVRLIMGLWDVSEAEAVAACDAWAADPGHAQSPHAVTWRRWRGPGGDQVDWGIPGG